MAREMSEHWAIGSSHLAFVAVLNALLAHDAWLAGGSTGPAIRVGENEQLATLHLVPDEPIQIHDAERIGPARSVVCRRPDIAEVLPHLVGRRFTYCARRC
jgi:hypothetical protein